VFPCHLIRKYLIPAMGFEARARRGWDGGRFAPTGATPASRTALFPAMPLRHGQPHPTKNRPAISTLCETWITLAATNLCF
jgi:hypothetical protein